MERKLTLRALSQLRQAELAAARVDALAADDQLARSRATVQTRQRSLQEERRVRSDELAAGRTERAHRSVEELRAEAEWAAEQRQRESTAKRELALAVDEMKTSERHASDQRTRVSESKARVDRVAERERALQTDERRHAESLEQERMEEALRAQAPRR